MPSLLPKSISRALFTSVSLVVTLLLAGCNSGESGGKETAAVTTGGTGPGTDTNVVSTIAGFEPVSAAVAVEYDLSEGNARPIAETPVELTEPTTKLTMDISNITYGGVVCGFTFKGTKPASPLDITMTIDLGNGEVATAKVPVKWTDTGDQSGAGANNGWNFGASAGDNQAGSGWVVQLGGIPAAGGKSVEPPKRSRCVLDAPTPLGKESGPVHMWAGFATK